MKLFSVMNEMKTKLGIEEIIREANFDTLALATTDIKHSFCTFIDDEKYIDELGDNASMVITTQELASCFHNRGVCISNNPRITFFKLHNLLVESNCYIFNIDFTTKIGIDCKISNLACIASKNVQIGNNVVIEEFVSIKENTAIGDNSIIRAGTIVGGAGFEFKRIQGGNMLSVKHAGGVRIGDYVEVQHNVCIEKAIYPWDATEVGDHCKIDDLVQIGHGVKVGNAVLIAAGSLIGGRTVINAGTWIGLGATISNNLNIGTHASVSIGSVATQNVEDNATVTGNFAINHKRFIEFIRSIR